MTECIARLEGEVRFCETMQWLSLASILLPIVGLALWMPWGGLIGLVMQSCFVGLSLGYQEWVREPKTKQICGYDR
jgi:hypothetical protein